MAGLGLKQTLEGCLIARVRWVKWHRGKGGHSGRRVRKHQQTK